MDTATATKNQNHGRRSRCANSCVGSNRFRARRGGVEPLPVVVSRGRSTVVSIMSVVVAFGSGDEVAHGFVTGDVVARSSTSGARRQARTGDDDCSGAAMSGGSG